MARTFGKLLCTIWTDPDFLALSANAKVLYLSFISQPDITPAGIVALTERRWRPYLGGDLNAVSDALDELHECRFVLVDEDTAEVWVKSFIEHDGRLENDNLAKSVHRAAVDIRSPHLITACHERYPDIAPGRTPFERPSNADGKGSRRDVELLEPRASSLDPKPAASSPLPSDTLDEFGQHVIDLIIGQRLRTDTKIRNPTGYRAALARDLPAEHGARIAELHEMFPTAAASSIASAVVTGDTRPLAGHERKDTA